ncbi:DsbA family protein [Pararhodospirillum oryzae]|uniref:DSBA oxidoreductase n=1 Tax=Pararhodospirillum oryzae TaxID=478448 RepID=A0A512HA90_9PROT|nr:DsbA family protein [Pararhodospirillum oryzae]GEO82371.1 DSBA oxidoreductase [Pararhodospirillum oryzae]
MRSPARLRRPRVLAAALTGSLLGAALLAAPGAQAADPTEALTPAQADAVRALIRETLTTDPTVLKDAVQAMQAHEQQEEMERASATIRSLGPALTDPPGVPALGNPDGDVTVIEFSDYNCGYCKRVFQSLWEVIQADGKVKLHILEFPILGAESVSAARAALAAIPQGHYESFHRALMAHKGGFSEDKILALAREQGLDAPRLKKDMTSEAVNTLLAQSYHLAQTLGISGTPAFVIGDHLVPGALSAPALKEFIAEARRSKS